MNKLKIMKSNLHRRVEYWGKTKEDSQQIAQAVYVALLEIENALQETIDEVKES